MVVLINRYPTTNIMSKVYLRKADQIQQSESVVFKIKLIVVSRNFWRIDHPQVLILISNRVNNNEKLLSVDRIKKIFIIGKVPR